MSNTVSAIQNGLIWAKVAAAEVLAGKITAAQAAQQLWNIAMGIQSDRQSSNRNRHFVGVLSGLAIALSGNQ